MNICFHLECQYNRDTSFNQVKDEDEDGLDNEEGAQAAAADSDASGSSRRSSLGNNGGFSQKVHRQTAKQKLRQLQELVAMVQVRQAMVRCHGFHRKEVYISRWPPFAFGRSNNTLAFDMTPEFSKCIHITHLIGPQMEGQFSSGLRYLKLSTV